MKYMTEQERYTYLMKKHPSELTDVQLAKRNELYHRYNPHPEEGNFLDITQEMPTKPIDFDTPTWEKALASRQEHQKVYHS